MGIKERPERFMEMQAKLRIVRVMRLRACPNCSHHMESLDGDFMWCPRCGATLKQK